MKRTSLIIIGTGDFAETAFEFLNHDPKLDIIGFSEEEKFINKSEFKHLPIYKFNELDTKFKANEVKVLVAVGPNQINSVRERLFKEVKIMGFGCITYRHPKSIVLTNSIGENSFIFPGCIVEPFTSIGNNCVMWSGSILAHHSRLSDHCFVGPGCKISGRVIVKENCFLGINSTIRDNIIVEQKCIVGAGAVIKKNTVENGVYSASGTSLFNKQNFSTKI